MKLTARRRPDHRDATRAELLLTRAGHHLWAQARRLRSKSGDMDAEKLPLNAALEIVWEAKRRVKAKIEAHRAERFEAWRSKTAEASKSPLALELRRHPAQPVLVSLESYTLSADRPFVLFASPVAGRYLPQ
jgi:hypothetical protein